MAKATSQSRNAANIKQQSYRGKNQIIVIGLVLAIIGSIIGSSYAKETLTNYTGFAMLMVGMAILILGACATIIVSVRNHLCTEMPISLQKNTQKTLFLSIWAVGAGLILTLSGSILGSAYEKSSLINVTGFGMMLTGICIFVLGIAGTAMGTLKIQLCEESQSGIKIEKPRTLFLDIISIGVGAVLSLVGDLLAGSYAKESLMNYTGFAMLLVGVSFLSVGISGTVVAALKSRFDQNRKLISELKPRVILGSVWAIGIGLMLLINGSLIASSYAKNTLINYAGFGMLLLGTGVFVYGVFETARISATGYLSIKKTQMPNRKNSYNQKETFASRIQDSGRRLVKTSAVFNLAGVMVAVGLLFFSLWQLDIIVSGPVWWEASPGGQGWSWPGPGAYANDYFQCFVWKTTVGQAYDTLFMLIFISFIVLFASAFFWPKRQLRDSNRTLKLKGQNNMKMRKRVKRRKKNASTATFGAQPPANIPKEEENVET